MPDMSTKATTLSGKEVTFNPNHDEKPLSDHAIRHYDRGSTCPFPQLERNISHQNLII
jgi:hypothetical protein